MGILSRLFGRGGDSFKVEDLKGIRAASEQMYGLQSYDPKRDLMIKNMIKYRKLAVGAAITLSITDRIKGNPSLKSLIENNQLKKHELEGLRNMCDSFLRRENEISDGINTMASSKVEGLRQQAAEVRAGFEMLKTLIPRLAEIVFEN